MRIKGGGGGGGEWRLRWAVAGSPRRVDFQWERERKWREGTVTNAVEQLVTSPWGTVFLAVFWVLRGVVASPKYGGAWWPHSTASGK